MADEDGKRARRAADTDDDGTDNDSDSATTHGEAGVAADAVTSRPKRFLTPDWDDWDAASEGSPDDETDEPAPVRGGRFAAEPDDSEPQAPQTPVTARGRFSLDEDAPPAWPDRTTAASKPPVPAWPTPTPGAQ